MNSIQGLRITTLADNAVNMRCLGQWGLSLLLEFVDAKGRFRKVIFDTGMHRGSLMFNVKTLKVKLSDIDCVVISHGHLDHTAATVEMVKSTGGAKVYAHPHTFLPRFNLKKTGKREKIGVPKGQGIEEIERVGGEVVSSTEPLEVVPGLWTTGQIDRVSFEDIVPLSAGDKRIITIDGEDVDDKILDDQALWAQVDGAGNWVITGCAHSGLVNTLLQVERISQQRQINGLVGGTHLVSRSDGYLQQTMNELKQFGLKLISPCHCTGFKAMTQLWKTFPDKFVFNFSGRIIEAGKEPKPRVL
jgi:7,8-dihydropterin-6-yl-methyl-4-(beta-D-ribofuranosyl)aminobenzene 5'-phosphate synthase